MSQLMAGGWTLKFPSTPNHSMIYHKPKILLPIVVGSKLSSEAIILWVSLEFWDPFSHIFSLHVSTLHLICHFIAWSLSLVRPPESVLHRQFTPTTLNTFLSYLITGFHQKTLPIHCLPLPSASTPFFLPSPLSQSTYECVGQHRPSTANLPGELSWWLLPHAWADLLLLPVFPVP